MLNLVDRSLGWLLIVGTLLHAYGSYLAYAFLTPTLVWAWSGSVAGLLLGAINLLRVNRPYDRSLAWVAFFGCVAWLAITCAFAATLPNPFDFRPIYHVVVGAGLAAFSLRTALRGTPAR